MTTKGWILAIVINAIWVVPFVKEIIIDSLINYFKASKRDSELLKSDGRRLKCMECTYCKSRLYKPMRNSYACAMYYPSYCQKFHKGLNMNLNCVCIANNPEQAEREGTTQARRQLEPFSK